MTTFSMPDRMGGDLALCSDGNKGSTFRIAIPTIYGRFKVHISCMTGLNAMIAISLKYS